MYHAMSHGLDGYIFILFFKPINQNIRRRSVVGGCDTVTVKLISECIVAFEIGTAQANAINCSIKLWFQLFANLI